MFTSPVTFEMTCMTDCTCEMDSVHSPLIYWYQIKRATMTGVIIFIINALDAHCVLNTNCQQMVE